MSLCELIKICNPFVMFYRIEVSQIFKIFYYSQTTAMNGYLPSCQAVGACARA